jgi:hypothetical protein
VIHHLADAAREHMAIAVTATVNGIVGLVLAVGGIVGAEVNDGLLTGAILFILATGTSIAGWSLVLLVRLSGVVAKLETTAEEHERRLTSGGI